MNWEWEKVRVNEIEREREGLCGGWFGQQRRSERESEIERECVKVSEIKREWESKRELRGLCRGATGQQDYETDSYRIEKKDWNWID